MPDAGGVDTSSYAGYGGTNRLLAAATNTPDVANAWQQNALQKQQLSSQQYEFATKKLGMLNGIVGAVITDPSPANAQARIMDGIHAGVISPEDGAREMQQVASFGGDPNAPTWNQPNAQIKQYAFQHQQMNATIQQQLDTAYGTAGLTNNGQQLIPTRTIGSGPNAGVYAAGGNALQQYMTPGQAAAPADYTGRDGTVIQTTTRGRNQAVGDTSSLPPVAGSPMPSPGPGAGGYTVPLRNGGTQNVNPQGRAVTATGQPTTVSASAPNIPQPGMVPGIAGPAPGYLDAAKAAGTASAEQGIALQRAADGAPVRKAMLANLNDDLDKFTSGPGADWQQVGKAWANRNVLPQSMQFDPQSIASQEAFNKQATQLAQQQFQALGGTGTDNQLSSSFKANPNGALSQLGNRQIIQLLQGNEDALAAKANAWQSWQQNSGANTYGAFQQDFNKNYNPRVYQAMYMDPQQIAAMRKNMSPAEQQQFARDYVALKAKGYITPGAASGQ